MGINNDPFLRDLTARIQLKQQQKRMNPTPPPPPAEIEKKKPNEPGEQQPPGQRSPSKRRISFSNKFQERFQDDHFSKLTSGLTAKTNGRNTSNGSNGNDQHITSESFTRAFNKLNQNATKPTTLVELNSRKFSGPTSPISFNKSSPMAINNRNVLNPTTRFTAHRVTSPRININNPNNSNNNHNLNNINSNTPNVASSIQPDFFTPSSTANTTTSALFPVPKTLISMNSTNNSNGKATTNHLKPPIQQDDSTMLELDNFEEDVYPQESILSNLKIESEAKPTIKLRSLVPFNSNLPKEEINKIENTTNKAATISSVTFMNASNLLNKQPDEPSKLALPLGELEIYLRKIFLSNKGKHLISFKI